MTQKTYNIDFKDLKLDVSHIESVMGYKEGEDRELVSDHIAGILAEAEEFCDIRAEYRIFMNITFNNSDKSLTINDLKFDIRKVIFGQIRRSDSIAVFLCTAGEEIGLRSRQCMKEKDLLRGYIYDVVGSEVAEAAADIMQNEMESTISMTGKRITNRYSPGYCGWNVSEQHKLFQLVPDNFCGIRLTESALMDPVKSVSGIIGIGEFVKRNPYTCNLCDMKDCIYRRAREKVG